MGDTNTRAVLQLGIPWTFFNATHNKVRTKLAINLENLYFQALTKALQSFSVGAQPAFRGFYDFIRTRFNY